MESMAKAISITLSFVPETSTTVSLFQLGETFFIFPIDPLKANRCREAWKASQKAAHFIKVQFSDAGSTAPTILDLIS
jgi:hypothetical protein